MNIVVTGATGFLGKYLIESLKQDASFEYSIVSRKNKIQPESLHGKQNLFYVDFSVDSLVQIFKDADAVIHLAAQTMSRATDPLKVSEFYQSNVQITENVLMAAAHAGVKSVYLMSSNNVYSFNNTLPFEESDSVISSTPYGISKVYAEILGEYFAQKTELNVVSLRLARLFGYGERSSVVFSKYMERAVAGEVLEIWGSGRTCIEYLYVKDAVSAIMRAIEMNIPSGIYNVGANKTYSIIEIASIVNRITHNNAGVVYKRDKDDVSYKILMDSSKFYSAAKWHPSWSLELAIEDIYKYYTNYGK